MESFRCDSGKRCHESDCQGSGGKGDPQAPSGERIEVEPEWNRPDDNAMADVPSDALQIRRGTQAGVPLHVAIVGGGKACSDLLHLLDAERLSRLNMKILGVFDKNPEAPGLRYAKEQNLFVTNRMEDLFHLEGLNLIIELTGVAALQE